MPTWELGLGSKSSFKNKLHYKLHLKSFVEFQSQIIIYYISQGYFEAEAVDAILSWSKEASDFLVMF